MTAQELTAIEAEYRILIDGQKNGWLDQSEYESLCKQFVEKRVPQLLTAAATPPSTNPSLPAPR